MEGYALVVPFLSDNPAWALGFEAGKLYEQMNRGESPIEGTYHAENDEQILVMAANLGYEAEWTSLDNHWVRFTLKK